MTVKVLSNVNKPINKTIKFKTDTVHTKYNSAIRF